MVLAPEGADDGGGRGAQGEALASWRAARSVPAPPAVAHTPSPGAASGAGGRAGHREGRRQAGSGPRSTSSAAGTRELGARSIVSQRGSPERGRGRAVQRPKGPCRAGRRGRVAAAPGTRGRRPPRRSGASACRPTPASPPAPQGLAGQQQRRPGGGGGGAQGEQRAVAPGGADEHEGAGAIRRDRHGRWRGRWPAPCPSPRAGRRRHRLQGQQAPARPRGAYAPRIAHLRARLPSTA